ASLPSLVALAARHGLNEATVAYLVAALADKSIVSASFAGGAARYDVLDTVREYVLERLAESGGLAAAPAVAVRLGTLGWYFALADRVSEGRRFLELALSATNDEAPVELRIEQLADLCYLATEEFD